MDAITYVKALRIAPTGERLNPSQKLCLILLALSLNEQGEACPPNKDLLADYALVSTRSVKRIISELEAMRLIIPLPQYTQKGQDAPTKYRILDAQGESVTHDTPQRGRVLPTTRQSVTGDTLPVANDTLPRGNVSNNLSSPVFGTPLALSPSPSLLNTNGGAFPSPAVKKWAEVMQPYGVEITPEIAGCIVQKEPKNLSAWEETLKGWIAQGAWSKTNIDGQLDRYYDKTLKRTEYSKQGNNPPPPEKSIEQTQEDDRHRQIIYGGKVER